MRPPSRFPAGSSINRSNAIQLWQQWVERTIGGSQQQQAKAMQAILRAIRDGKSQTEIAQDALAVVGSQRHGHQAPRLPSLLTISAKPGIKGPFGVVSGLQRSVQQEKGTQSTVAVWTFRIRLQNGIGVGLTPITFYGLSLQGSLADGDLVLVDERAAMKRGGNAVLAYNHTTGGAITRGPVQYTGTGVGRQAQLKAVRGVVCGWVPYSERRSNSWRDRGVVIAGWSFRIATTDSSTGDDLVVPVEMRAIREIKGIIRNGDEVKISEAWRFGETLTPKVLVNISTSTTIKATVGSTLISRNIVSTFFTLVFGGVFLHGVTSIGVGSRFVPILLVAVFIFVIVIPIYRQWK